jgi:hypothetical protein
MTKEAIPGISGMASLISRILNQYEPGAEITVF